MTSHAITPDAAPEMLQCDFGHAAIHALEWLGDVGFATLNAGGCVPKSPTSCASRAYFHFAR